MKTTRLRTIALFSGLGLVAPVPWLLASCATTEAGTPATEQPPVTLPEAGLADAGEAPVDGGCDASDPDCVTKPLSCDEAAWCPVPTNVSNLYALTAIWGSGKDDVWAAGSGGTMIHWDGAAWKPTTLPSPTTYPIKNTFHAIWGSGPNDVWAASATNVIFHTDGWKNGAATWERAPNGTDNEFNNAPIYAAWGDGKGELRFGGRPYDLYDPGEDMWGPGNQIVKTEVDGGLGWAGEYGTATIYGYWGTAEDLWIIGDNSTYVHWQLGLTLHGTRANKNERFVWTEVDSQSAVVLRGIWGSSAADVWAVGDRGTIRHITPGATQWEIVASPTNETLHAVWGAAANDVWAVGESGAIVHWDGASWKTSTAAFPVNKKRPHLYGVWGSGPNDVWIVGNGIALHYTGGAK